MSLYILEDMRQPSLRRLYYFDDINQAEHQAVTIMDSLPFRWQRCEYDVSGNTLEYAEASAVGTCQVIVRVSKTSRHRYCECGEQAVAETRRGFFCKYHFELEYGTGLLS